MLRQELHLSDSELLMVVDGELSSRRAARARKHIQSCWTCRERLHTLEETITNFVRIRNLELAADIPSEAGPRALLRARIEEIRAREQVNWWTVRPLALRLVIAGGFLALGLAAVAILGPIANAAGQRPNARVTPGETRPITLGEVCRSNDAVVVVRNISDEKRRAVLAEYGVKGDTAAFEVDYLITPDLGGSDSIRNMWPQPYSTRWNAKVKDRLEQRLHELVCAGKVDLYTAQRELASDWIEAYKQYMTRDSGR